MSLGEKEKRRNSYFLSLTHLSLSRPFPLAEKIQGAETVFVGLEQEAIAAEGRGA